MVRERKEQSYLTTVSLVILAFIALAVALLYTRTVMIPFVVALFIVSLVSPVQDFQVKRLRFPRIVAAIATLLVVFFIVALVSLLVTYTIQTVVSTARDYGTSLAYVARKVLEPVEIMYGEEVPAEPEAATAPGPNQVSSSAPLGSVRDQDANLARVDRPSPELPATAKASGEPNGISGSGFDPDLSSPPLLRSFQPDANAADGTDPNQAGPVKRPHRLNTEQLIGDMRQHIVNILTNAAGTIFGLVSGVFFVIIFVMFLVMGRDPYATHSEIYTNIVGKVRRYVGTKVVISLVTGLLVWLSLSRLGLPLASVFGILAFLLNFIPSIGSVISTLLPMPVAVATFQGPSPENADVTVVYWAMVLLVVAIPGAIQITMGNVIEPKLMGGGLNLHPVTVLLALSFWGLLWGIVGMFLAAPITAAIRIVLMQFDTLRPIGNLLAGDFSRGETAKT